MASNAKNLAELLNNESTIAVADVADGSITTAKIADDAVTNAKIGANAVGTTEVANDAVTEAKINPAGLNLGRRNLIINGAMQVAQRGTSATGIGITGGYNTVDRWRFADSNNPPARFTETQSTDAPEGFGYSRKFEVTTNDGSVDDDEMQYTDHFIEAQNLQLLKYGTSNAESFTLSFYVKSSVASTMGLRFTHEDGGGNYGAVYTINATNTWERKTITVPGNTSTAINNDTGRGLRIAFGLTVGADNAGSNSTAWGNGSLFGAHTNTFVGTANATWQITGVQLEVGSSATDFEHRSLAEEIELCKRYYQLTTTGENNGPIALGTSYSSSQLSVPIPLHPEMRATPTIDVVTGSNYYRFTSNASNTNFDNLALDIATRRSVIVMKGSLSGMTGGNSGYLYTKSTSAYLALSAEL